MSDSETNYSQEETQTTQPGDRRIRDAYPTPKRRNGDVRVGCNFVSARELDLLARIDEQVERIRKERERKEGEKW